MSEQLYYLQKPNDRTVDTLWKTDNFIYHLPYLVKLYLSAAWII